MDVSVELLVVESNASMGFCKNMKINKNCYTPLVTPSVVSVKGDEVTTQEWGWG